MSARLSTYFQQSQLALAAYAVLSPRPTSDGLIEALVNVGMTDSQAEKFLDQYKIISQYGDVTGLSATVFEDRGGARYLAIRGTQSPGDFVADTFVLAGWPSFLNPQFLTLRAQVQQWMESGVLPPSYTVTGHSLGGYLAAAIGSWFRASTNGTYLINAPGVGGVVGNFGDSFKSAIGLGNVALVGGIQNIRGSSGISAISGLGAQLASPIFIETEFNANPIANHSIETITDSLAVYALLEQLTPEITLAEIATILRATSNGGGAALLNAVVPMAAILGVGGDDLSAEGREKLYRLIQAIESHALSDADSDLKLVSLVELDTATMVSVALGQGEDSFAYRYALKELNPFALIGEEDLYAQHNLNGELELFDGNAGEGAFTSQYLADRAEMLRWKNISYEKDGNIALRGSDIESREFVDKVIKDDKTGNDLTLTVVGRQRSAIANPAKVIFGGDGVDSLAGSDLAAGDRLYGGGGNDTLQGKQGADYLEGGSGSDTYIWNAGDGFDTILDTDGIGKLIVNGVVVPGGVRIGQNDYISSDKKFSFHFESAGSEKNLVINGDFEVENFRNGDLGITLDGLVDIDQIQPTETTFAVPYHPWSSTVGFGTNGADHVLGVESLFESKGGDDFLEVVGDSFAGFDAGAGNDVVIGGGSAQSSASYFLLGSGSDIAFGGAAGETIIGDETFLFFAPEDEAFFTQSFNYDGASGEGFGVWDQTLRETDYVVTESQLFHGSVADALQYIFGVSNPVDIAAHSDDYIDGGGGSDRILGGGGSDTLFGGEGDDVLIADGFSLDSDGFHTPVPAWLSDWVPFMLAPGDDYVDGGPGNDVLGDDPSHIAVESMGGSDVLIGGDGNDVLTNIDPLQNERSYFNLLDGGDGNDTLSSDNLSLEGFDTLIGGAGDDILKIGDHGNASLEGGAGNDSLTVGGFANAAMEGGAGNDFYLAAFFDPLFFSDQPSATIEIGEVEDSGAESDFLSLSVTTFSDISMLITRDESSLYIGTANMPRWLTISDWFEGDGHKIETIAVAINKVLGTPELMFLDVPAIECRFMVATDSDDALWGSPASDQLAGGLGNDVLVSGDGDDTLEGGKGNDVLDGGKGADRYVFRLGDGVDRIADSGGIGSNGILFGPGITQDMLAMDFDTLTLRVGEDGDAIEMGATDAREGDGFSTIEYLQFADSSTLSFQDFLGQAIDLSDAGSGTGGGDSAGDPVTENPGDNSETGGAAEQGGEGGSPAASINTAVSAGSSGAARGSESDIPNAPDSVPFAPGSAGSDSILTWWPEQSQIGQSISVEAHSVQDGRALQPQRNDLSELLESYLAGAPRLDFEVPGSGGGQGTRRDLALTPTDVARRWEQIDRYMKTLAEKDNEDARESAGEYRIFDSWNFMASADGGGAFGFAGSTGATRGMANMRTLQGLTEGLQQLRA